MCANIQPNSCLKKTSRNWLLFRNPSVLICLLLSLCFGCQPQAPLYPDTAVFRYNEHANITSLDPAFAKDQRNIWACHQLYNTLVQLDENLEIQPDLAESWKISEDATTYTFNLKPQVYFHENEVFKNLADRQVQAQDVVYSLKRLTDKQVASPGSWVMNQVKSIEAINNNQVQIKLYQAFPGFLGLLSMKFCSIIPQEMQQLDFRTNPIGTGPFYFKRWEPNEKLVFRKNTNYHEFDENGERLPYLEAVAITFLPDKQAEFLQFAQGKLDFLSGLDPAYKDELLNSQGQLNTRYKDQISMQKAPYLNTEYIGLYVGDPQQATHYRSFRHALNYAIDKPTMMRYLRNNIGVPAQGGFIPRGLPAHTSSGFYTYQPEKARALIQKFKQEHPNIPVQLKISTSASYLDLVEYLQGQLTQVGIQTEVEVMPPSTLRQLRSAGKLAAFRASWIADYPDAQNYLSLFYKANWSPHGPNYTHYASATFDSLYQKAMTAPEAQARESLYRQMDALLMQAAPVIPLYYDEVVRFTQKNVHGLGINAINLLDLKRVQKQALQ